MRRGVKKKDYENLSAANIKKVIALLRPGEGSSQSAITKKAACDMLNISYNTTRLDRIIEDFLETQAYISKRKSMNRGKPATDIEIGEAVMSYLQGATIADIAKGLYRSPSFVKNLIEKVGVPQRLTSKDQVREIDYLPDECVSDSFEIGEIVWSARYHRAGTVIQELSPTYVQSKKGLANTDYEAKYACKCYDIHISEATDSEDSMFPGVSGGGFFASSTAYDLGKLTHLKKYGVNLETL